MRNKLLYSGTVSNEILMSLVDVFCLAGGIVSLSRGSSGSEVYQLEKKEVVLVPADSLTKGLSLSNFGWAFRYFDGEITGRWTTQRFENYRGYKNLSVPFTRDEEMSPIRFQSYGRMNYLSNWTFFHIGSESKLYTYRHVIAIQSGLSITKLHCMPCENRLLCFADRRKSWMRLDWWSRAGMEVSY